MNSFEEKMIIIRRILALILVLIHNCNCVILAAEGTSVAITCGSKGKRAIGPVKWEYPPSTHVQNAMTEQNGNLNISKIQTNSSGPYTCRTKGSMIQDPHSFWVEEVIVWRQPEIYKVANLTFGVRGKCSANMSATIQVWANSVICPARNGSMCSSFMTSASCETKNKTIKMNLSIIKPIELASVSDLKGDCDSNCARSLRMKNSKQDLCTIVTKVSDAAAERFPHSSSVYLLPQPACNKDSIQTNQACPSAFWPPFRNMCVPCTPGSKGLDATSGCIKCDKGTYQPLYRSNGCIMCPDGYTTADFGSQDVRDCVPVHLVWEGHPGGDENSPTENQPPYAQFPVISPVSGGLREDTRFEHIKDKERMSQAYIEEVVRQYDYHRKNVLLCVGYTLLAIVSMFIIVIIVKVSVRIHKARTTVKEEEDYADDLEKMRKSFVTQHSAMSHHSNISRQSSYVSTKASYE